MGNAAHTCKFYYDTVAALWHLLADDGLTWLNSNGSQELYNSQCRLNLFQARSTIDGQLRSWSLPVYFNGNFAGSKQIWMYATASTINSGWQQFGTWTVAAPLQFSAVQPSGGSGAQQVFQFSVTNPNEGQLLSADLLINSTPSRVGACLIHVDRVTLPGVLYLRSDDDSKWIGPGHIGSYGTPQNAQCAVDAENSHAYILPAPSGPAMTYTFTLAVRFKPGFAGARNLYLSAIDGNMGAGPVLAGSWTIPTLLPTLPFPVSVSPSSGFGTSGYFTFAFADPWGVPDLESVRILFGGAPTAAQTCLISINPQDLSIQLQNDSGTGWLGPVSMSNGLPLANNQCSVLTARLVGSVHTTAFTVALTIVFKPAFSGLMNTYMQANGFGGVTSGWQVLGTYHTFASVPTNVSLSPSGGSGHSGTFRFTFADPAGAEVISNAWMWFGLPPLGGNQNSINVPGTCLVFYTRQSNVMVLMGDSGISSDGGSPGSPGSVHNSQCTLDLLHSSVEDGSNLTIQVALTFSYNYSGNRQVWARATESTTWGAIQQMGNWTIPASALLLSASPNPATFGEPVTLTATPVAGAVGQVTFYDDATVLGTSPVSSGVAALTTRLLAAGKHKLTAYFWGAAPGTADRSSTLVERVNAVPGGALTAPTAVNVGANPTSLAVGDFNRDGFADLAVANQAGNSVGVLVGNGDGSFRQVVAYQTGAGPKSIATGDFNLDGKLDLAAGTTGGVSVLLGNGDATFQSAADYAAGAGGTSSVAVADLDNNGVPDLFVGGFGQNTVLAGYGNGMFANFGTISAPPLAFVVSGDFDGDGNADIAGTPTSGNGVFVLRGNGDFTFRSPVFLSTLDHASFGLAVADINGDDRVDLSVATQVETRNVLIFMGLGSFELQDTLTAGLRPYSLAVSDFNGDGKADLVVTNICDGDSTLEILLGKGDGTVQTPIRYPVGTSQVALALGDFNGDGRTDVAAANFNASTVSVFLGAPQGSTIVSTNPASLAIVVDGANYTGPRIFNWAAGSSHTISAASPQGTGTRQMLLGWSDGGPQSHSVTPYATATYTAHFKTQYLLTKTVAPNGGGTITATPTSADGYYDSGTVVQLTATPTAPYDSVAFSGDVGGSASPQTVNMSSARSVTATFSASTPVLKVTMSHSGYFTPGQNEAVYTVAVSNLVSTQPTSGEITVQAAVPAGLTLLSMAGTEWTCPSGGSACTRADSLAPGANYPPITVTVKVASDAPPLVVNAVGVSGGGSTPGSATDPTTISVGSPCDVNRDTSTNVADVQMVINEALGVATATHDLNLDGSVNVADVQRVINAALGLGCGAL